MSRILGEVTRSLLACALFGVGATGAQAQTYNVEKAEQARTFFATCADSAENQADQQITIATCKTSMNGIAGLFSAYPEHTPTDLNILAVYSGAAAYVIVAMDLQLHENRLSIDGCNHADHVVKMYNTLTSETNEQVEAQLRQNAENAKQALIPWCNEVYPVE